MLIIGRITEDAVVKQLEDQRELVSFSIAVYDYYKSKGSDAGTRVATFFNCSYWISTAVAKILKKGALVEISGRVSANAYINAKGEAKATLNCHVRNITLHSSGKGAAASEEIPASAAVAVAESADDLPF